MSELNNIDEEVNAGLSAICNKYNLLNMNAVEDDIQKDSVAFLVKQLYEEFDSIGIEFKENDKIDTVDIMQLVTNVFKLINIHRKTLAQMKENNIHAEKMSVVESQLRQEINSIKKYTIKQEDEVKAAYRKIGLLQLECNDLKKDKQSCLQQLENFKKIAASRKKEFEHTVNQLRFENLSLKDDIVKNIGTFKSQDAAIAATIQKYKFDEEVYKDTIRKLQDNNQELLGEILNLKEEVLRVIYDKYNDNASSNNHNSPQ